MIRMYKTVGYRFKNSTMRLKLFIHGNQTSCTLSAFPCFVHLMMLEYRDAKPLETGPGVWWEAFFGSCIWSIFKKCIFSVYSVYIKRIGCRIHVKQHCSIPEDEKQSENRYLHIRQTRYGLTLAIFLRWENASFDSSQFTYNVLNHCDIQAFSFL